MKAKTAVLIGRPNAENPHRIVKRICWLTCISLGLTASAAPVATVTGVAQDAATGRVTVTYDLEDGPAIMTLSASAEGATYEAMTTAGDVNVKVETGVGRKLFWTLREDMGNVEYAAGAVTLHLKAWSPSTPPDYMAVNMKNTKYVRYFVNEATVPGGVQAQIWKTEYMLFRRIPAKGVRWRMGSPSSESERNTNAQSADAHDLDTVYVTSDHDYYMAVYEMTAQQYYRITTQTPSTDGWNAFSGYPHHQDHVTDWQWHPVTDVSYADAETAASKLAGTSALSFRLPTEEEWEFACRAGSGAAVYGGYSAADVAVMYSQQNAFYGAQNVGRPHYACSMPVGLLKPNAFGLYDMLGNVREWCIGPYDGWYDAAKTMRTMRGGNCAFVTGNARAASRGGFTGGNASNGYLNGFRLCLPIE